MPGQRISQPLNEAPLPAGETAFGGEDRAASEPRIRRGRITGPARAGRRVPDFFIVGHQKCGTTALYRMLKAHPQVFMPSMKEPRFLASDLRDRFQPRNGAATATTLEQYLSLFDGAGSEQRVGEASPVYLTSHTAAGEIARLQPAARIIAILREPASFLRSLHLQFVENHVEREKSLRKAIALEHARRQGKRIPRQSHRPQVLFYSEHVRYVEQLRRYHALFPPEQILVLIYDDYRRENDATMRRVLRYLEVDSTCPVPVTESNPTVSVRRQGAYRIVRAGALKVLAPSAVRSRRAVALRNRLFPARAPDEELMLELRRRFKPEVVALSDYLARDLVTLWGYDRIS